jgi:MFS family permease
VVFLTNAGGYLMVAALPLYLHHLGFSPPAIGLLVGLAWLTSIPAGLLAGGAIDRFGGRMMVRICSLSNAVGALLLLLPLVPVLAAARVLQGFGWAGAMPAAYSLVPGFARKERMTLAFASVGAANNVALVIFPPLGLWLYGLAGTAVLFPLAALLALGALAALQLVPLVPRPKPQPLRLRYRSSWTRLLLVVATTFVYWGMVSAFLPLHLEADHSVNTGVFFSADALGVLALRVPAGLAVERFGGLRVMSLGIAATAVGTLALLVPASNLTLAVSGLATGIGAAFLLPPLMAALSIRAGAADRGAALAYFSVAAAVGQLVGSAGGGRIIDQLGFSGLLWLSALAGLVGLPLLFTDPHLRGAWSPPEADAEPLAEAGLRAKAEP